MVVVAEPRPQTSTERAAQLRCIDTDIHNDLASYEELRPYLADEWHPWLDSDSADGARRYYANMGSGRMDDAVREEDDLCAGDPDWVIQQLMTRYRIDIGVLTGSAFPLGIQPNHRLAAAIASAYNDWLLDTWVRPHPCFKGSLVVTAQAPEAAAREIRRLGDDPGMVQVLMPSAARIPYGQEFYWPMYAAAAELDLPVAIHVGAEGVGIANAPTSVGYPSTYLEYHTDHSLTMMAHCVSLVTNGAFEAFPSLKFAFIEGGVCWAPHVMWRLDRAYPRFKAEAPFLKRLPSEYILDHCYFSTQPIEEPDEDDHLLRMLDMLQAERTVIFASDYPHWDFDNPLAALNFIPRERGELKRRIFVDNALAMYGPRLLATS
ncbi:MAG: amidohydrolase [Chloroflexota bacterium]|nr:amidohydrolase [Chloroflexota bacterium]